MWIVFNIGCIQCEVSSKIVGMFADKAKADEVAASCNQTHAWRENGCNSFEVFESPIAEVVDSEYT